MLLPSALGFSPHPPVSVYGTGTVQTIAAFLGSRLTHFPTLVRYASHLWVARRFFQPYPSCACPWIPFQVVLSFCVPTVLLYCSTGISTCCPSATTLGLALGPDFPRADQGASVKDVQVKMDERTAGESYLNLTRSIAYMLRMMLSILFIQNFRKRRKAD